MNLRADHQHPLVFSGLDELVRDGKRINKSRALRAHVDGGDVAAAKLVLHEHARAGEAIVGAECGEHDQVQVLGPEVRAGQRLARGLGAQIARAHPVRHVMPLLDARALHDPLVRRVHQLGQLVIGHHPGRDIKTRAHDPRIAHFFNLRQASENFPLFYITSSRQMRENKNSI